MERFMAPEVSSWTRNYAEDEELEDVETEEMKQKRLAITPIFRWIDGQESFKETVFDSVIIGTAGAGQACLYTLFGKDSAELVASIEMTDNTSSSIASSSSSSSSAPVSSININDKRQISFIYTCTSKTGSSSVVFVQMQHTVTPEKASAWVRSLRTNMKSSKYVVLDAMAESQFRYESERPTPPFLRKLQTTVDKNSSPAEAKAVCPPLEAPNMVEGLCAAFLSAGQMRNERVSVYVTLQDNRLLEADTVSAFEPVLQHVLSPSAVSALSLSATIKQESGTKGARSSHLKSYAATLESMRSRKINSLFM